jgi:hypothetical protein
MTDEARTKLETAIACLSTPGMPYPGYRPNDEDTDQPLPLYGHVPKVVRLVAIDWRTADKP